MLGEREGRLYAILATYNGALLGGLTIVAENVGVASEDKNNRGFDLMGCLRAGSLSLPAYRCKLAPPVFEFTGPVRSSEALTYNYNDCNRHN